MDQIFGNIIDDRFKVSLADSTMMWIVHHAMNKAQEKMKTKKGVIERLNEISRFYELAVMQLEGCLSFVETETSSLESNHEEVLADLREIKDRLQGRLEESEWAIWEKDRELKEKLENELKLMRKLELKERELVSLRGKLGMQETKGDDVEEEQAKREEDHSDGGVFSELKTSFDQKKLNIKQGFEPHHDAVGEESHKGIEIKVEEMGSDIDILKQTMDHAFGKMHSAMFMLEMGPKAKQWKLKIEKDVISITIRSFMREFQEKVEEEVMKKEKEASKIRLENWSQLMNEATSLRHELTPFISQHEMHGIWHDDSNSAAPSAASSPTKSDQKKDSPNMGEKASPEENSHEKPKKLTPIEEETDQMEKFLVKEENEDGGHIVAKIIKSHESIIRQKSEELSALKLGILHEKKASSARRQKEQEHLRRKIQDFAARFDNLISWIANTSEESPFKQKFVSEKETILQENLSRIDSTDIVKEGNDTLENIWKKMQGVSRDSNDVHDEILLLNQEKEDRKMRSMVLKDIHLTQHKDIADEFDIKSYNCDIERLIQERVCEDYLKEVFNQWNEEVERKNIESQIRDEVFFFVFSEATKEYNFTHDFVLTERDPGSEPKICNMESSELSDKVGDLEDAIHGDVCMIVNGEMFEEQKKMLEVYSTESLVKEEISQIVFSETIRNMARINSFALRICTCQEEYIQESILREDIYMIFFKSVLEEWIMELENYCADNLVREQIHQFIVAQALKDAFIVSQTEKAPVEHNIMEDIFSISMLNQGQNVQTEVNLINILQCLLNCVEAKERLMLSAKSEIRERSMQLDVGSDIEELHEHKIFEDLLFEEEETFSSLARKVDNVLQQLGISKELVRELSTSLGFRVCDSGRIYHHVVVNECQIRSSSVFMPLMRFSQTLTEFEGMVNKRLQIFTVRLEKMKYCMDPIIELVDYLRSKESLFRNAFIHSCKNLHKAEDEILAGFESMINKRLQIFTVRLEKMKYCLDMVIELVDYIRSKDSLYRNSFIQSCKNLQKVEAEILPEFEGMVNKRLQLFTVRFEKMKCCLDPAIELVHNLRSKESLDRNAFIQSCKNLQKIEAEIFAEVEDMVNKRLQIFTVRLEKIKYCLDPAIELASHFRSKESLYRNDFIQGCKNFQEAEAESLAEFEGMVNKRLQIFTVRLEKMKYCMDPAIELVGYFKTKESLCRNAFSQSCKSLQQAEIEILAEFEGTVNKRLQILNVRLEKMKYCLDPTIESVCYFRTKEYLHRNAFIRSCKNLEKAEVEILAEFEDMVYKRLHVFTVRLERMRYFLDPAIESVGYFRSKESFYWNTIIQSCENLQKAEVENFAEFEGMVNKKLQTFTVRLEKMKCCLVPAIESVGYFRSKESFYRNAFIRSCKNLQKAEAENLAEFEDMVHKKLQTFTVRLEKMKYCLVPAIESVGYLRSKESLYQNAFIQRCKNLQKAEVEVDLLGDQVDALVILIKKIYKTLHQYAPALQQYFEVYDILKLIKKELSSGAVQVANFT